MMRALTAHRRDIIQVKHKTSFRLTRLPMSSSALPHA